VTPVFFLLIAVERFDNSKGFRGKINLQKKKENTSHVFFKITSWEFLEI